MARAAPPPIEPKSSIKLLGAERPAANQPLDNHATNGEPVVVEQSPAATAASQGPETGMVVESIAPPGPGMAEPGAMPGLFRPQQPMAAGAPADSPWEAPRATNGGGPASLDEYAPDAVADGEEMTPGDSYFSHLGCLGLRHSSTHGRHAGMGVPLQGTSWLNRPYYAGVQLGEVWITSPPTDTLSRDMDLFGGVYLGYDWDYYWGGEVAIDRATPELKNSEATDERRGDRRMLWTANVLYYPWGDSYYRPYWRCGLGAMEIDYPLDDGSRRDEALWAIPIGVGIKYPVRRWLAARAEFTDHIGLGNTGVATQHDLSLTVALEWRFGVRPRSYWPWYPSRHIW